MIFNILQVSVWFFVGLWVAAANGSESHGIRTLIERQTVNSTSSGGVWHDLTVDSLGQAGCFGKPGEGPNGGDCEHIGTWIWSQGENSMLVGPGQRLSWTYRSCRMYFAQLSNDTVLYQFNFAGSIMNPMIEDCSAKNNHSEGIWWFTGRNIYMGVQHS